MIAAVIVVCCSLVLLTVAAASRDFIPQEHIRSLIFEASDPNFATHVSTPCNPAVVGSTAACFDKGVTASNNKDYPSISSAASYPKDGTPFGVHITPYSEGTNYLISWLFGKPTIGAGQKLKSTSSIVVTVQVSTLPFDSHSASCAFSANFTGTAITYLRNYTSATAAPYSYQSPYLAHVVLLALQPHTTYYYKLISQGKTSKQLSFKTLANRQLPPASRYPLKIGLIADPGQTQNSTATRDHLLLHKPDVVFLAGDNSYADNYGSASPDVLGGDGGCNDNRWDIYSYLFNSLFSGVPLLNCAGNHELETTGIPASVTNTSFDFSFPTNYPFQAYSARFPVPDTYSNFGNINNNMYYKTNIGGIATVITLNTYAPFYAGTPQYQWFTKAIASVDRTALPWLFVQYHTPIYHTYLSHFKEAECFRSIYEPLFYKYGVDIILNGHVHAYERTHPIYNYTIDTCGPIHLTIGDGGNIEGPYRNFVDEINPNANITYCEQLTYGGLGPNAAPIWGPGYQTQVLPAGCPTKSWQTAYSVKGKAPLVAKTGSPGYGFCQSSQPLWSAHRDPSFGHAILNVMSATTAEYAWYRNVDGEMVVADSVVLNRDISKCSNKINKIPSGKTIYSRL